MPLRAIINNKDVLAPFLLDEDWRLLKTRVKSEHLDVRVPCCGNIAYLRTSKHGVNHFVHKVRDACTSADETSEHLRAKHEIVLACRAAGYDAITEVSGDGWRADVLAVKGRVKIAFEVQWSPQTWKVTKERQKKYEDAGIRGCWLFKRPPVQYHADKEVPLFKLEIIEDVATVIFNPCGYEDWRDHRNRRLSLSEFVTSLLQGKIRFCEKLQSLPRQTVRIDFYETDCEKCNKPFHVYYVDHLVTGCGHQLSAKWFDPQFIELAMSIKFEEQYKHIRLGSIKPRYSKTTGRNYKFFYCPHCDNRVTSFDYDTHSLIPSRGSQDKPPTILEKEIALTRPASNEYAHWCFPEDGQFCC